MRVLGFGALLAALAGSVSAQAANAVGPGCLSGGDVQEIVSARSIVSPGMAVGLAIRSVPNAQAMRAWLCRAGDGTLVYTVVMLRKDGKVVHVTIDAPSGKLRNLH